MNKTAKLVRKAQGGNQEAFVQLIKGYEEVLYNVALRFLHNETDVADVLQETILIAYKKISTLKKPQYFNTWICRILINQCKQMKDKEKIYVVQELELIAHVNSSKNLELQDLLYELDLRYAIPLVLYYYNGFSIAEISEILSEPIGTIKSKLSRGRKLLRKEFDQLNGGK